MNTTIRKKEGELKLSTLPPNSLHEAAELAAAAFDDSPVYNAICHGNGEHQTSAADDNDDDERRSFRRRFLCWLFERNFRMRVGTSANRAVFDDNGKLIAFFMFVPPDIANVGLWDMLRVGILQAPFLFGIDVVKRLLVAKADSERIEREIMEDQEFSKVFRLERMVVHPSMQGKGVGSHALRQALDEADGAGLPVMLNTQEERNLRFYGRLGFEVVGTHILAGHTNWTMLRRPVQT